MRVKVSTEGHQYYHATVGDVILWCQAVEHYPDGYKQVPAVLVDTGERVELVPLQAHLYWTKVEIQPVGKTGGT